MGNEIGFELILDCQTFQINKIYFSRIGNQDQNYKLETIVKSGECCVNSSIKIIDGAGHFPHQSHPNQVNRILSKTFDIHLESPEKYLTEKGLVGRMIQKMYGGQ